MHLNSGVEPEAPNLTFNKYTGKPTASIELAHHPSSLLMSRIYLSWGMGVESNAILTRWLNDPTSRDFPLEALTVITAQTGDEHIDTKTYCETYILPLLRTNRVRLVQVARAELTNYPMNYYSPAPSHNLLAYINAP